MQSAVQSRDNGCGLPSKISPVLLTKVLSLLSNDELDQLDAELCDFEETGVASPRVNRVLEVLQLQEARRRSQPVLSD